MKRWCPKCEEYEEVERKEYSIWNILYVCKECGTVLDNGEDLLESFCDFAHLEDNSDAELPNIKLGWSLFCGDAEVPESLQEKLKGWDVLEDVSMLSPACLLYILYRAKEFWEIHS